MSEQHQSDKRVYWIDILRGLAILVMIPANMAPYLAEPHNLLYRFIGSFAAPIFILLSAGMVVLRSDRHSAGYYVQRAGYVMLCGVLLDTVLWRIVPFMTFDVLYTIGIGMVAVYFLRNVDTRELLLLTLIIFLAAYAGIQVFGYHEAVPEVAYLESLRFPGPDRVVQSWFLDGWFPLFPWLGFALLGSAFFKYIRKAGDALPVNRLFILGLILTAAGLVLLFVPIPHYENFASNQIISNREGYSEIFYPPTPGYLLMAIGIFLILLRALFHSRQNPIGDIISYFGKHSMLVYLSHQILGYVLVGPVIRAFGADSISIGWFFAFANLMVIGLVYLICQLAGYVKQQYRINNAFLQVIIGK